ncbi:MAG: glycosyltransferase family 4 protein [Methanoregulaceae archaeon]|nr:glycosyltransferase family 4 protein [Methanoregulaceae archaeon]HQO63392.1 glycosyltransferase family 4 protein [Syntrophorhabdus sp.]
MKIIQVCPRYYPDIGGVETHVREIAERLVKMDHKVEVVCTDPNRVHSKTDFINGVSVTRFRSFAPHDAFFIAPKMKIYLKTLNAEILHAHGYHAFPALFAMLAAREKRFIFTPHYHGKGHTPLRNMLLTFYNPIGRAIFHRANRIICVSEYEKNLITGKFSIPEERFIVIPNGLNLSEFKGIIGARNPHRILHVGRIEQYKGIQYIIDALSELPDYTLTLVGKGPYEPELYQLAVEKGVLDRITWKKNLSRNELLQEYTSAGLFISLSSFEAYGITVAEALVSGLQVIVNKKGALGEFVDGTICIGIDPTTENLVNAITTMKHGQGYQKQILDWDEVVKGIVEIYSGVLS